MNRAFVVKEIMIHTFSIGSIVSYPKGMDSSGTVVAVAKSFSVGDDELWYLVEFPEGTFIFSNTITLHNGTYLTEVPAVGMKFIIGAPLAEPRGFWFRGGELIV